MRRQPDAAVALSVGDQQRSQLFGSLRTHFARNLIFLQAQKYTAAVASDLKSRNGWTIAEHVGDRTPDRTQRLLNKACWDQRAVMAAIRRYVFDGLATAARANNRIRGHLSVLAVDETGQQKKGTATAGVKRQHLGCAGRVANGVNTVHVSLVREGTGHCLIGFRQWIPAEQLADPAQVARMRLPADLTFRTKGELAVDVLTELAADGVRGDFVAGDEVYGESPALRTYCEAAGQAYILRVRSNFHLVLGDGTKITCKQLLDSPAQAGPDRCEQRSAGIGSKGERWYEWRWFGTASARHTLLARRHLVTGELAFHYCFVPADAGRVTLTMLIKAAGLRWPIEEGFEFAKDDFGLDQSQVRLYHALERHTVLVMAALAIRAVTAALLRTRTDTQARPPKTWDQAPPTDPGRIPLTVVEVRRLMAASMLVPVSFAHHSHWSMWRRRHQARSRWFHKRARLPKPDQPDKPKPDDPTSPKTAPSAQLS